MHLARRHACPTGPPRRPRIPGRYRPARVQGSHVNYGAMRCRRTPGLDLSIARHSRPFFETLERGQMSMPPGPRPASILWPDCICFQSLKNIRTRACLPALSAWCFASKHRGKQFRSPARGCGWRDFLLRAVLRIPDRRDLLARRNRCPGGDKPEHFTRVGDPVAGLPNIGQKIARPGRVSKNGSGPALPSPPPCRWLVARANPFNAPRVVGVARLVPLRDRTPWRRNRTHAGRAAGFLGRDGLSGLLSREICEAKNELAIPEGLEPSTC